MPSKNQKMGLWGSTSLIIGNMIGSGIFLLPVALAAYGGISLIGWLVSAAGAIFLALVFVRLNKMMPGENGGPYIYSRKGLGHFAGFLVAWGYWISILATNGAIAVAFVSYLSVFVPALSAQPVYALLASLATIWLLTWVNTLGIREASRVQIVTTILKLLPLVLVTVAALFYVDFSHFKPFNIGEGSHLGAITATATITLFAFMGMEVATIPAGSTANPEKTIPRATMLGTLLTTGVYILSSFALMGLIHPTELQNSNAPYADAASLIWGSGGELLVTIGALISTFGALNGWILLQGQTPFAAARDGAFPAIFGRENKNGVPALALVVSSVLISILLVMNYTRGLAGVFEFLILLTATTVLIPYMFSAVALIILVRERSAPIGKVAGSVVLGLLAFGYAMWAMVGAGQESIAWGFVILLAGVPVYAWQKSSSANKKKLDD